MTYTWCCMYNLRLLTMDGETSETCRLLFQNKVNLRYCASVWFYYSNTLRCTVLQTPKKAEIHLVTINSSLIVVSFSRKSQFINNNLEMNRLCEKLYRFSCSIFVNIYLYLKFQPFFWDILYFPFLTHNHRNIPHFLKRQHASLR